jgi:hypothetical protein
MSMEDDLGYLQREVWQVAQTAATAGDGDTLSIVGSIAGEMTRKCREWRARFEQLSRLVNHPQADASTGVIKSDSVEDDYTGKSIRGFEFNGVKRPVGTYTELLVELTKQLATNHPDTFETQVARIRGRKPYFSHQPEDLRDPREVKPGFFIQTNFANNLTVRVCRELVNLFGYRPETLVLDVAAVRTRAIKGSKPAKDKDELVEDYL